MTQGRSKGIRLETLAAEFWRAFATDRHEVLSGKTHLLALIQRLSPALDRSHHAQGLVARAGGW